MSNPERRALALHALLLIADAKRPRPRPPRPLPVPIAEPSTRPWTIEELRAAAFARAELLERDFAGAPWWSPRRWRSRRV